MPRRAPLLLLVLAVAGIAGVRLSAAAWTDGSENPGTALATFADWSAPAASAAVVGKATGGATGAIRPGATFYVYATVSDSGNPASGVASVAANVASLTTGGGNATMAAGSYTAYGVAYNYRSALLTAKSSLQTGLAAFALSLADAGGNSVAQSGFSVAVDATAPTASDVQSANAAGGTAGRPEAGDQLVLTYAEPIDRTTILAGWSGAETSVVVRIVDGAGSGNDVLTVRNAGGSAQLPLGSINLGRNDYVTATRDFAASAMAQSGNAIAVTLGTPSGTTGTAAGAGALVWSPSATATDWAGNAASTGARTETGAADADF